MRVRVVIKVRVKVVVLVKAIVAINPLARILHQGSKLPRKIGKANLGP